MCFEIYCYIEALSIPSSATIYYYRDGLKWCGWGQGYTREA